MWRKLIWQSTMYTKHSRSAYKCTHHCCCWGLHYKIDFMRWVRSFCAINLYIYIHVVFRFCLLCCSCLAAKLLTMCWRDLWAVAEERRSSRNNRKQIKFPMMRYHVKHACGNSWANVKCIINGESNETICWVCFYFVLFCLILSVAILIGNVKFKLLVRGVLICFQWNFSVQRPEF